MIDTLLLDLDNTILDFDKSEELSVRKALSESGLQVTDEIVKRYSEINKLHWQMLERQEITRDQVLFLRFKVLFNELNHRADAKETCKRYESLLAESHIFIPGAMESLNRLNKNYRLYLVSNGAFQVQDKRLADSGLYPIFQEVFISEKVGADKPSKEFFKYCFARIPEFDADKTMIVGDSMTSDMLGGIQSGIKTCWINPAHSKRLYEVDLEIETITQLEKALKTFL